MYFDGKKTTLERAFELAREGTAIVEIRRLLKREGYPEAEGQTMHLSVLRQLRALRALHEQNAH